MGRTIKTNTIAEFVCECGGHVTLAEGLGTHEVVALHTLPECKWFLAADSKALFSAWKTKQRS